MKTILVFLLLMPIGLFAFKNEPKGFRGYKWGDMPDKKMSLVSKNGNVKIFDVANDKLKIGNAYFTSIKYKFFENKFAEADAFFTTQDTFNRLESILREKFGRPTYTNILSYSWYGNTIVILFYNPISNVGILSIANKKLARKADEDERKAELEKAEKDF